MVKVLRFSLFCAIMLGISCTTVNTPELPPPQYSSCSAAPSSSSLYYYSSYDEWWNVSSSSVLLSSSSSEEGNSEVSSSSGEEASSSSELENNDVSSSSSADSLESSSSGEEVSSSSIAPSSSSVAPSSSSAAMCGGIPLPQGTMCCEGMARPIPGDSLPNGVQWQCCEDRVERVRVGYEMCCGGRVQTIPLNLSVPTGSSIQCCGVNIISLEDKYFCTEGGGRYQKCGGVSTFDPRTQRCCGDISTEVCPIPSSSSVVPSSSSVAPSSSSRPPSSSSVAPSSSSVTPSSSSFDCLHTSLIDNTASTSCASYNELTQFCDTRDGKIYKYVKIGTQTWMAENLVFKANSNAKCSACYNDLNDSYCGIYGRLYNWTTAMNISSAYETDTYNAPSKHKGICPSGWHLPDYTEWTTLVNYARGDDNSAGTRLKATTRWKDTQGEVGENPPIPGEDTYGFTALPGGIGSSNGSFTARTTDGVWWSTKAETTGGRVNAIKMGYNYKNIYDNESSPKSSLVSVRCIKD